MPKILPTLISTVFSSFISVVILELYWSVSHTFIEEDTLQIEGSLSGEFVPEIRREGRE